MNEAKRILLEEKIKQSAWWQKANVTVDSHYDNTSGIMLSHHLLAVHYNVAIVFQHQNNTFYNRLFELLNYFGLTKETAEAELKLIALLHDLGKLEEDKSIIIPHPITGKPAHKRHGLVSMMMATSILEKDLNDDEAARTRILRTVELHDMSYGLFREFKQTGQLPLAERWKRINDKINPTPGAGILYLLLFKLADTHGHLNIEDVVWFYHTVKEAYYQDLHIDLPLPTEEDVV